MIQEPGLQLDERQRAMLEAMHIKVWQPPARSVAVPVFPPVSSPNAIKSIAADAYSTGAEAVKDPVKPSKTIPSACHPVHRSIRCYRFDAAP
jgi:hypothetical protein